MKRIFLLCFLAVMLSTDLLSAQSSVRPADPTPQEIEKMKRLIAERREEYIATFLTTLEGDEFQKEIVQQYINSYLDERTAMLDKIYKTFEERERELKKLNATHFKDLEGLISENDMAKIKELTAGEFDEKKAKKKNKKKKKKNDRP